MSAPRARVEVSTRHEKFRFRYTSEDSGGFVELDHRMSREDFVNRLKRVTGVRKVTDCVSKFDLECPGNALNTREPDYGVTGHYLQANVLVKSSLGGKGMEFELTFSCHMKGGGRDHPPQRTVSMVFKKPTKALHPEAWRISRGGWRPHSLPR